MAAGQKVMKKPVDMGRANLSRRDLPLPKPSSKVRHDSAVQANRTDGVTPTAKIAGEGLGNHVNLVTRNRFTSAGTTA